MNKLVERLTNFEESELLNGVKSIQNIAQIKTSKALLAGTIFLGSTALVTGIIPVKVNVAGNQISNIEEVHAVWKSRSITYRWGSINKTDEINFCRRGGRSGYVRSGVFYVTCLVYRSAGNDTINYYYQETSYPKGKVCDFKVGRNYRMWIASNGKDCWDSYLKWTWYPF